MNCTAARGLVVVFLLLAARGARADETPEPLSPPPAEAEAPRASSNVLVPLVEIPAMAFSLATFNRLVFQEAWTNVTLTSVLTNLKGGWVFDSDNFEVNNIGHPWQGSFSFLSARSSGFGFWGSMLAAFLGSLLWELAGEAEPPSVNDMLTTPFGGAFLGEALRHSALELVNTGHEVPWWLRGIGAAALDPMGSFNRWLFEGRYDPGVHEDGIPVLARLGVGLQGLGGINSSGRRGRVENAFGQELHLQGNLRSGLPGARGHSPLAPFDYFSVQAELTAARQPYAALFVSGLLWGGAFDLGTRGAGTWGLFGNYDFADPPVLRISTVSVGPGVAVAIAPSRETEVQGTLVLSGIGWGAAGNLAEPGVERTYRIGPGLQALLDVALLKRDAGHLHGTLRQYVVNGVYGEAGIEAITYFTAGAGVAMGQRWELLFDAVVSIRQSRVPGATIERQQANQLRVSIAWLSELGHGGTPLR